MKKYQFILLLNFWALATYAQKLKLNNQEFELKNVTGSIVNLNGEQVLKIERDLKALPFDVKTWKPRWMNRLMPN
jgi:hypothetical protein